MTTKLIQALEQQIEDAQRLKEHAADQPNLAGWKTQTAMLIQIATGRDSIALGKFQQLTFFRAIPASTLWDGTKIPSEQERRQIQESAYQDDLDAAIGIIEAVIKVLQLQGESPISTFDPQTLADMLTGENAVLEYKASMRWDLRTQQVNKALEKSIAKTVAGFLNSEGGTLLIGVADDCTVLGIEYDLKTIGRKDRDGYEQMLHQVLTNALGAEFSQYQHVSFEESEGRTVCIVRVDPSPEPVYLMHKGNKEFYVRVGNTTRSLDVQATHDYISMHWPA